MSCSTNSSTRAAVTALVLASLVGCVLVRGSAEAPVELQSVTWDHVDDPVALKTTIRWRVVASGGTGDLRYTFKTLQDSTEILEQEGSAPTWDWRPRRPGAFRVKVAVVDAAGGHAESGWLPEIVVAPTLGREARVAVFPLENLTGGPAPYERVAQLLYQRLGEIGVEVLDPEALESFMERHRVRNTSGVEAAVARAVRAEAGVDAVLLTSLEAYDEAQPPKVSLFSRLVLTTEWPEIVWMDGVGLRGDAYPGFLNLQKIEDPDALLQKAVVCLTTSLDRSLWDVRKGGPTRAPHGPHACDARGDVAAVSSRRASDARHRPQAFFRSPKLAEGRRYRVAVLPFVNLSGRGHAGEIVSLHVANQLLRDPHFTLVEPGLVREELLKYRVIMEEGPSIAQAEVVSSERSLGLDLVCSGAVFDYQDALGVPKVDLAVQLIDAERRRMVWSSRSRAMGNEGVRFFDVGRIYTAHRLTAELTRGAIEVLTQ